MTPIRPDRASTAAAESAVVQSHGFPEDEIARIERLARTRRGARRDDEAAIARGDEQHGRLDPALVDLDRHRRIDLHACVEDERDPPLALDDRGGTAPTLILEEGFCRLEPADRRCRPPKGPDHQGDPAPGRTGPQQSVEPNARPRILLPTLNDPTAPQVTAGLFL